LGKREVPDSKTTKQNGNKKTETCGAQGASQAQRRVHRRDGQQDHECVRNADDELHVCQVREKAYIRAGNRRSEGRNQGQ